MLVALSGAAYVVIFSIPLAREKFMLDPSNVWVTSKALTIGVLGAGGDRGNLVDPGQGARRTAAVVAGAGARRPGSR